MGIGFTGFEMVGAKGKTLFAGGPLLQIWLGRVEIGELGIKRIVPSARFAHVLVEVVFLRNFWHYQQILSCKLRLFVLPTADELHFD